MLGTAWFDRRTYDVAHVDVYSGTAFSWADAVSRLLRRAGKPFVMTLHGGNLPSYAAKHRAQVRRALARADAVVAPSGYLADAFRTDRNDIRLIPNPLDVSAYRYRPRATPRPRLVWLRAFHEVYNPQLAVRVVAELAPAFPDLRLTMIGPDKDRTLARTRDLASELGVQGRITFTGAVPKGDVPAKLADGDIFLNTTTIDNTPVSVLEALATGMCVISTNVGGVPFLLEPERDALLVPSNDVSAMASAVTRILTERGLAATLSTNARAKAESHDWTVVLHQWQTLFRAVAARERLTTVRA